MSNPLLMRRRAMMQSKKGNILTFTAEAVNSSVQLTIVGTPQAVTLEYNLNDGGWLPYTIGDTISLPNVGDNVKLRGNNATFSTSASDYYQFVITGYVAASGDVTSLQSKIGGNIALTPACYRYLFRDCTGLTAAPELPSTTLQYNCYRYMFFNCTGLTQGPKLFATTLAMQCYFGIFQGCTAIISHDVATLNESQSVFCDNSSCISLTIHAVTPPAITDNTITGLKSDCKIYVPYSADHSILDAYKTAQYWSARAAYIYELDENGGDTELNNINNNKI